METRIISMQVIKFSDIKSQLKDVVSQNSQSSGRVIINENFHLLNSTLSSVWDVINAIYDPATEKILTLALMADVKITGLDAPNVGDALVWKGGYWGPAPYTGGSSGNGAQFLTQLLDVVAYNYPITNKSILQYDIFANKFAPVLLDIFALANSNLVPGSGFPAVLTKNAADQLDAISVGAPNTWMTSDGVNIGFNYINLSNINDVVVPLSPSIGQQYILQYQPGNIYELQAVPSLNSGIQFIIPDGQTIQVLDQYQYIVHQHLYLDGDIEVDGELVIL